MILQINLLEQMKARAILNRIPKPIEVSGVLEPISESIEIYNPYPVLVAKVKNGEIDLLAHTEVNNNQIAIDKARTAVQGFAATNNTRKAVEALADALENQ